MLLPVILLAAFLGAAGGDDNSIALSVAATRNPVALSESVTLVISLTNRSDKYRYIHRNVERTLDFAVRDAAGRLVRYFNDPPPMPLEIDDTGDFVRIEPRRAYRCVIELPLDHLGIERAGAFSVVGFWAGASTKVPKVGVKEAIHFEDAEAMFLTVIDDKAAAMVVLGRRHGLPTATCRRASRPNEDTGTRQPRVAEPIVGAVLVV